jgi:tRNA (cmo5U34)-methyltransferase
MTKNVSTPSDPLLDHFSKPEMVAQYLEGPRKFVPGLDALLRMTTLLLAEQAPANMKVLVLGAGGGSDLLAMADAHPDWTFVGVDPSREMLDLASETTRPHKGRIELIQGYIDAAPTGPFDAATCLLTLHFLDADERERTLRELHRRLRPGAAFVVAHSAFPQSPDRRDVWLDRYALFAIASGFDPGMTWQARAAVAASLYCFEPARDEAILRASGFSDIEMFYAAFTWRGWVCRA